MAGITVTLGAALNVEDLEIPVGVSLSLDLNGKVLTVSPLFVNGSLAVTDSSAGKTGWIDAIVIVGENGALSYETVRTFSNRSDLNEVLSLNRQGAKVSARLAKNLAARELTIPTGESLTLDLNGKRLVCEALVVNGTLTVDDSTGGWAVCVPSYPSIGTVGVADDGTEEITIPANVSSGFYRLQSKGW